MQIAEGKFLDIQKHQKIKFEEMGKLFLDNYSKPNKRSWRRDEEKGEILNLKWPDVDFRRKIITILKTKSQKKRENRKIVLT
ncbi:MAG: hypothetical protein ACE5HR_01480 [bacterium]